MRNEWDALFEVLASDGFKAHVGPRELDFEYEPMTEGLPNVLYCLVEYEYLEDHLVAHSRTGTLREYPVEKWEILSLTVQAGTTLVDPEELEIGLTEEIKERALELIQGS